VAHAVEVAPKVKPNLLLRDKHVQEPFLPVLTSSLFFGSIYEHKHDQAGAHARVIVEITMIMQVTLGTFWLSNLTLEADANELLKIGLTARFAVACAMKAARRAGSTTSSGLSCCCGRCILLANSAEKNANG
jgi:hypothetical protein